MDEVTRKEKQRLATQKYNAAHPEKIKAYYQKNKARINAYGKAYRDSHKQQEKERSQKYQRTHPEQTRIRDRKYRETHREQVRQAERKADFRRRLMVLRHYAVNPSVPSCACCGETEIGFLSIDHIKGNGNKHRQSIGGYHSFYSWMVAKHFPEGFQILCMNCNWGKRIMNGVCPHQKMSTKVGSLVTITQGTLP